MPFDERRAARRALEMAGEEFRRIVKHLAKQYPDLIHKGPQMIAGALPTATTDRDERQRLAQIADPEEWMAAYQEFVDQYGAQRAQEMLTPRRTPRPAAPPPDEDAEEEEDF